MENEKFNMSLMKFRQAIERMPVRYVGVNTNKTLLDDCGNLIVTEMYLDIVIEMNCEAFRNNERDDAPRNTRILPCENELDAIHKALYVAFETCDNCVEAIEMGLLNLHDRYHIAVSSSDRHALIDLVKVSTPITKRIKIMHGYIEPDAWIDDICKILDRMTEIIEHK